jgi:hypothetical protein
MGKTTEDSLEDRLWKLQREVDPDDIRLEPILLAIAELDRQGGRLVRARALVRRVMAMRSTRLGPFHPSVQALAGLAAAQPWVPSW